MGKNIADIKISNRSLILSLLYFDGPLSRKALSVRSSLTRAAITGIVGELLLEKILRETEKISSSRGAGRSETLLELCSDNIFTAGVHFSRSETVRVAVSSLDEKQFYCDEIDFNGDLKTVKDFVKATVNKYLPKTAMLCGLGVTVHGIADSEKGISVDSYGNLPKNTNLLKEFENLFPCTVTVENNIRAMLVANAMIKKTPPDESTLFIKYGQGVGGAYAEGQKCLLGANCRAVEIGHIAVTGNDKKCLCSKTGCLETLVSYKAVEVQAKDMFSKENTPVLFEICNEKAENITAEAVFLSAERGDNTTEKIVDGVVERLSLAIANFDTVFDAKNLIVCSDMFIFEKFCGKMEKAVNERCGRTDAPVFIKNSEELKKISAAAVAAKRFLSSAEK